MRLGVVVLSASILLDGFRVSMSNAMFDMVGIHSGSLKTGHT